MTLVKIICPIHGEFEQLPSNHYKYGCNQCSGKCLKTKEDFILESSIVHKNKFDYSLVNYIGMFDKVIITCKKHGPFEQIPTNHLHGRRGCPSCSNRISKNESLWLDGIGLPNDKLHRNVYINIDGKKYFTDGYNGQTNTVYEFNGDYWHGNLSIYDKNEKHPIIGITYQELFNKTENKKITLEKAGFNVVSIWESEFLENYKDSKIIIINNKYGKIITYDEFFKTLRKKFSYKAAGIEYSPAYKNGWDGITHLIDNQGNFLIGNLDKIKNSFQENNIQLSIIDKRVPYIVNDEIDISNKLLSIKMAPRDYQERIVNAALSTDRGIVRSCTGSGKTLTTALITAKLNKPTIIYVIGLDLLKQFHDLFSSIFDEPIGFIGNGICDVHRINIASIWTIGNAVKSKSIIIDDDECSKEIAPSQNQEKLIQQMLKEAKLHIFDESHVVTTDTIKNIMDMINPENIYGFSGTPFRDDGSDLLINGILGDVIVDVPASELISKGFLAQPLIKFVRTPKNYKKTKASNYQTVYKEYIVENKNRNDLIVSNAKDLIQKQYQVLVLFKNLTHGKTLKKIFDQEKIKYEYLSGANSLEERVKVKENLLSNKSNLVLASSIFDIGIDISSLSALILASGGKSSIRALQRIGRVIRSHKNKKTAAIVDFYDDVNFLRSHSQKRYAVYLSEPGFKLLIPNDLKDKLKK